VDCKPFMYQEYAGRANVTRLLEPQRGPGVA
jgi:hypothetical protein